MKFPTLFDQAFANSLTANEQEDLISLENSYRTISGLANECVKNHFNYIIQYLPNEPEKKKMDDELNPINTKATQCAKIFNVRRQKIRAQPALRNDFYRYFETYEQGKYAKEFLSFFLQYFVRLACHEKEGPTAATLRLWLTQYKKTSTENLQTEYKIHLLDMIYRALPTEIVENFVKSDFRLELEKYIAENVTPFFQDKHVAQLVDGPYLGISEPNRINKC